MAEWRSRGYVADSDEEEESQISLPTPDRIRKRAPCESDDSGSDNTLDSKQGDSLQDQGEEGRLASSVGTVGSGGKTYVQERRDVAVTGLAKADEQVTTPISSDAVRNILVQSFASQSDGDIDELQEGHYKDVPTKLLQAELSQRAQDFALLSCDTTTPPVRQTPSLLQPTSSLPSESLERPHKVPLLTNREGSTQREPNSTTVSGGQNTTSPLPPIQATTATRAPATPGRVARTLRQRNAIQLHPYIIEQEKYRRLCIARGMQSIRVDDPEAEAEGSREAESQYKAYRDGDSQEAGPHSDKDNSDSSPLPQPQSSPTPSKNASDIFTFGDDDDLPDMNTLLRNPMHKYVGNNWKRRKIATPSFRMPPGMIRAARRSQGQVSAIHSAGDDGGDDDVAMFDVPLSPPLSGSQTPLSIDTELPCSRPLRSTPQAAFPTPVTSSEPRRRQDPAVSVIISSDDRHYNHRRAPAPSDSFETEQLSSEDETPHQLQHAQRRIRGVLPASWLKLDIKARQKRPLEPQKPNASLSPEKRPMHRGVARPIARTRNKSPGLPASPNEIFILTDDEDSMSDKYGPEQRLLRHSQTESNYTKDGSTFQDRLGGAAEDDRVDPMLPTVGRSRQQHKKDKKESKRQPRLVDVNLLQSPSTQVRSKTSRHRHSRQPKITEGLTRHHKEKPRFRPPKLSILDAPSVDNALRDSVPRFIKVASRAARSRKDKGRHSPSTKYVRLATKEDDRDACDTLRNWREGTIAPSTRYKTSTHPDRLPLNPRSVNNAFDPRASRGLSDLKITKEATLQPITVKPRHVSSKSRKSQSSLEHLVERRSKEPAVFKERTRQPEENEGKRGQLVSSIRTNSDARPAMLEATKENATGLRAQADFHRDLSSINRNNDGSGLSNVLRLLKNDLNHEHSLVPPRALKRSENVRKSPVRRARKRRPHQMTVPVDWSRESSAPIIVDDIPGTATLQDVRQYPGGNAVTGLGPFDTRYSDTFDVSALPIGTYFHESTFVGSGLLTRSLKLQTLDLDSSRGFTLLQFDKTYRWGLWNENVSSELGELMTKVNQAYEDPSNHDHQSMFGSKEPAVAALRSIIVYFSDHLSFSDPIDRASCVQRCTGLINTLSLEQESGGTQPAVEITAALQGSWVACAVQKGTLKLVLANQIRQISQHELVPQQMQGDVRALVHKTAQLVVDLATREGLSEFELCLSDLKGADAANNIIRNHQKSIEAFVVAHHTLRQDSYCSVDLWKAIAFKAPYKAADGVVDSRVAEQSWKRLFTLLPFFELDTNGIQEVGRRFKMPFENWSMIKRLINPILEASLANARGQAPSFNAYCRTLFGRCLHLINGWGWRRCETIIGTLFDFFARNNMAHLRNEASHGSPLFLEHLARDPSLTAQPEDRCLHILLKIIGSGIRHMRRSYSEKKIRDIIWRLMPNHGRSYPKEEAIHQQDLDALRNHHDLLSTLYWASPPSCRPRLSVIRNLVHLESSHREACHINIRAWSNLVNYQLSTDEPSSSLQPFSEWHDDLLVQILRQHSLARTEAESQVRLVQNTGGLAVSNELLESTIMKNQRQVQAILSDALNSLNLALSLARDGQSAAFLMSSTLMRVFDIFDAGRTQTVNIVTQVLEIILTFADKSTAFQNPSLPVDNDDSQEYGDWLVFEDDNSDPMKAVEAPYESPLLKFQEPLRQLLSNCFGSDLIPDDDLLSKIIDVWVVVAHILVHNGTKTWNDYIDHFGSDSWSSLRDTEQTRKYTAFYFATVVEREPKIMSSHRTILLSAWLGSLVERESLLKYQHRFTEVLMNAKSGTSVLRNLPFWTDVNTGKFQISPIDFAQRRVSVISSVLSNMRESLEEAVCDSSVNTAELRQEYKDLLRHLMATMKRNYQELGNGSNTRGAYVDFVHYVVELLQQHTSLICPVDRFFTDNGAFPLPATDPTYVVAHLKNYALRLRDPKTPKQVAIFLQSVSERAAIDCQQAYLVGQLHTAMSNVFEDSTLVKPTLRSFLVRAIIPAYIETACTAIGVNCGWIIALPFLQALRNIFGEILLDLDGLKPNSSEAVASILTAFLASARRSLGTLPWSKGLSQQPEILKLILACFSAINALLPTLDYLIRLSGQAREAGKHVEFLKGFAIDLSAHLHGHDTQHTFEAETTEQQPYAETRHFATQELTATLTKNWKYDNREKRYYFNKGGSRREIVVDVGLYEEEKAELSRVFEEFLDCLEGLPAFTSYDDDEMGLMMRRAGGLSLEAELM